jgi:hypothetical protein
MHLKDARTVREEIAWGNLGFRLSIFNAFTNW